MMGILSVVNNYGMDSVSIRCFIGLFNSIFDYDLQGMPPKLDAAILPNSAPADNDA